MDGINVLGIILLKLFIILLRIFPSYFLNQNFIFIMLFMLY